MLRQPQRLSVGSQGSRRFIHSVRSCDTVCHWPALWTYIDHGADPAGRPFLFYNGTQFTLEECQLIYCLVSLNADYDLISEIIKHERMSPEPVNCAGLDLYLSTDNLSSIKDEILLRIQANIVGARAKARDAYARWMRYMTAIIWRSASLPLLPITCNS